MVPSYVGWGRAGGESNGAALATLIQFLTPLLLERRDGLPRIIVGLLVSLDDQMQNILLGFQQLFDGRRFLMADRVAIYLWVR